MQINEATTLGELTIALSQRGVLYTSVDMMRAGWFNVILSAADELYGMGKGSTIAEAMHKAVEALDEKIARKASRLRAVL